MTQKIKVLVIDNALNEDNDSEKKKALIAYLDTLRENSIDVETVTSEQDALALFENEPSRNDIDLALVDIRLLNDKDEDDISGIALARRLKEYLPVIVFTNYPSYEYARRALGGFIDDFDPADEFLSKAEGANTAVTAIRRIVGKVQKPTPLTQMSAPSQLRGLLGDPNKVALDLRRYKVIVARKEHELRGQNFDVLKYFLENQDRVISHEEIDREILHNESQHDKTQDRGRITNIINRIRDVIEENTQNPQYLKTVHGRGYIFSLDS